MPWGFQFQSKFHWISLVEHLKRRLLQRPCSFRIRQTSVPSAGVLTLLVSTSIVLIVLFSLRQYTTHRRGYEWEGWAEESGPQTPLNAQESNRLETIFHA